MNNKTETIKLKINGMHCASCAKTIESVLKNINGINKVNINFVNKQATIEYDKVKVNQRKIKKTIMELGYTIEGIENENLFNKYLPFIRLVLVGIFLLLSWLTVFFHWQIRTFSHWQYLENIFAVLAIIIGFLPILKNAIKTVLSKNLNVNVLISIAVISALSVKAYKEAATVIFIKLLGNFLENFTIKKTDKAVKKLMELTPQKVTVKKNGKEIVVPIEEVLIGDVVIVKPGEQVGVDGILLTEIAQIDQSVITGESMPIIKRKGKKILAGSISDGCYFEIKTTQVGENTTLFQIQQLIEESQNQKAPIENLADEFSKYFIPSVLFISLAVGILTTNIIRAITILIVACPCAFIIATPIAIVAAIGKGARRGILIKAGEYLESLGKIDTVIFDKTGTLTCGKPQVVVVKNFNDHNEKEIIELAAILESKSEHLLAKGILKEAEKLGINSKTSENVEVIKGKGIIGKYKNETFYLGTAALIEENKINISEDVFSYIKNHEKKGHTTVIIAHNNEVCGVICISDELRENAKETIKVLRSLGIENIWMMTGDNKNVAQNISKKLNIDRYFAQMLPQDKIEQIKNIQKQGRKVIMVGDGINDAPALSQADVGIVMGSGTDIAIESGDVILVKDDLSKVAEVIKLGRKTLAIIKQNLTFSLGFNFLMFILASLGIINMIGGALFHQMSSLIVIFNSMRLLVISSLPS